MKKFLSDNTAMKTGAFGDCVVGKRVTEKF